MPETLSQPVSIGETTIRPRRLAGVLLFALSAQFMTVIMLAAAMAPDYDFGASAISDLGTIPETALLFNGSLVLVGVLNIAGGYLLYRSEGARWLLGIYVAAGIGAIGAGLVPLDVADVHGLFALVAFLGFNLEALGTATRLTGVMRVLSILAGVLGLLFVVVMIVGDAGNTSVFGPIGHGGAERMIVYPVMLWLVAFGGYLLGRDVGAGL
ncbi:DUF998 domain-containing protein [Halapricum salinum]|uniref:DUF998 domain-containing protein n=1 Tax=Halapricum salinum TaxID=1457250 RepID=A0A4D6HC54_9EURY|nr:DUF998 domain-containing protein [Halapricum salinum]QCC51573.1 DUF998 domain-containing protein [Halapricum salinum]